ncbi:hypothetical protein VNO78_16566 [Psophocarpus tetragonolobus]|uniref:Uncharacterized protein n=1 Tax=Psophocarpus tetragonolobus TaxID=3891 RepID=A0AAN9SGE5_PSOTE
MSVCPASSYLISIFSFNFLSFKHLVMELNVVKFHELKWKIRVAFGAGRSYASQYCMDYIYFFLYALDVIDIAKCVHDSHVCIYTCGLMSLRQVSICVSVEYVSVFAGVLSSLHVFHVRIHSCDLMSLRLACMYVSVAHMSMGACVLSSMFMFWRSLQLHHNCNCGCITTEIVAASILSNQNATITVFIKVGILVD